MFKSVFLRRILGLIVITALLFAILTSGLYYFISRQIYADMKAEELAPKAESISEFLVMYDNGELPFQYFAQVISAGPSAWDAWVFILDKNGQMLIQTEVPSQIDPGSSFIQAISSKTAQVLNGEKVEFTANLPNSRYGMLVVGVPAKSNGNIAGAVFLAKPMVEINAGINSLARAMIISTLICMMIMILPAIFAANLITKPLKKTRDTALAMANGNFSVRADTRAKGEIGDLAASFNLLGERLEKTIADLVLEKNRLIRVLNGLAEGIIAVDSHCNVTHANPALWNLIYDHKLGQAYCDLPGVNERSLMIRPNDPQFIRQQLISDESVWEDFKNVIHTSTPIIRNLVHHESIIRVMITPIEDEFKKTVGAVGLFQDITEAEILEQTRRDYVANVSHELRTPLTAMRGLIEPLADGLVKSEEDKKRYYGIIMRETMRLSRLIEDMLELSRLQSGKITIDTKPFRIQEIAEDVVDKFQRTAMDKGVSLVLSDHFDTIPTVIGNSDRVEQVLIILIDNALKFTGDKGTVTLDAALDKNRNASKVYISVTDTGVGIEPEKVSSVFERFFKADQARYGTAGTGLGLSIAKEILNTMGENISVTSTPGKGSTFTFTLTIKK